MIECFFLNESCVEDIFLYVLFISNLNSEPSLKPAAQQSALPAGIVNFSGSSSVASPVLKSNIGNSKYGTYGLMCCGIAVVVFVLNSILANIVKPAPTFGRPESTELPIYITLISLFALLILLGGFVSSILGLCDKGKKKAHAIMGLLFTSLIGFGIACLVINSYQDRQDRLDALKAAQERYDKTPEH